VSFSELLPQRRIAMTRASAGEYLAAQKAARSKAIEIGSAQPLVPFTRREAGRVWAVFPKSKGHASEVDVSFLLSVPRLADPLIQTFLGWGAQVEHDTRISVASTLRSGFVRFLRQTDQLQVDLTELDRAFWLKYIDFLDAKRGASRPLAISSRRTHLSAVVTIFDSGARQRKSVWSTAFSEASSNIPLNPWPGSQQLRVPTERIQIDEIHALLAAAELEIRTIQLRIQRRIELVSEGHGKEFVPPDPSKAHLYGSYADEAIFMAALDKKFPGIFPIKTAPEVQEFHHYFSELYGGWISVWSHFFPTIHDLSPFVVWLAIHTAFNATTILELRWSDIERIDLLGVNVCRVHGTKRRAATDPTHTFYENEIVGELSIGFVLGVLAEHTARLRPYLDDHQKDFLFVYLGEHVRKQGKKTDQRAKVATVALLKLEKFCKRHSLPRANLRQIRATLVDEVHQNFGLVAASRAAHNTPTVNWRHYTSGGTRQRYNERLGRVLLLRERWFEDNAFDPRTRLVSNSMDRGAATPGFICLDPLDSPIPGQRQGRLCKAYAECPACPLGGADPFDPHAVALYLSLQRAVFAGQTATDSSGWMRRWLPVAASIKALLEEVPSEVLDRAKKLVVRLPPLPRVG